MLPRIANAITRNAPTAYLMVLLITSGLRNSPHAAVVRGMIAQLTSPENHARVAEMALERAKRRVEQGRDVVIMATSPG